MLLHDSAILQQIVVDIQFFFVAELRVLSAQHYASLPQTSEEQNFSSIFEQNYWTKKNF
jgi:hypothetical protein